jgi:release factor glutamine methyltransferase
MPFVSGEALWRWREQNQQRSIEAGIDPDELDWLLQVAGGLDRLSLRLGSLRQQSALSLKLSLEQLDDLWQQRLKQRVPVQYLAGVVPWRKFLLHVSPAVLIPRPETEEIIDLAIAAARTSGFSNGIWADLGTGSGAIALGLAEAFPAAQVQAVDRSAAALAVAQQNAEAYGLGDRIQLHQGNWFEPLSSLKGQLSGMVSNPPYIPSEMVLTLQPEVAQHEPQMALDGGADGLESIRHLVSNAPEFLKPGGIWLTELMMGQASTVKQLLEQQGSYQDVQIHRDLAGVERFVLAFRS